MPDRIVITKDGLVAERFTLEELEEKSKESIYEVQSEPVDEEKAFMAEAIIKMSNDIERLKQEIQIIKGGM